MARIRFLMCLHQSQRCQYLDITFHGGTICFENNRKIRNWCWPFTYSVEHTDSLGCECSNEISRIFKGQPQFGGKFLPTVQLTSTIQRSLKETLHGADDTLYGLYCMYT